jgi:predicted RNase H-like nuclease (RuvC/YqgF family)
VEINPNLLNLLNIALTAFGGMYAARLLYKQIFAKNQGDATKNLSDTVIDQNEEIERLQNRNQALQLANETLADERTDWRNKLRFAKEAIRFLSERYKAYAPTDVQVGDLEKTLAILNGDSGPLNGKSKALK